MLGKAIVRSAKDVDAERVGAGSGTSRQVLISGDEAPNFALRRFIMKPGGGMPAHTNTVEHEQYILKGKARVGIGEDVFEVAAGDAVYIPDGVPIGIRQMRARGSSFFASFQTNKMSLRCAGPRIADLQAT